MPHTNTRTLSALAVWLSVASAAPLLAQDHQPRTRGLTIGASGGFFIVGGEDFSATDDALGVNAYIGYRALKRFDVNLGVHYSSHGLGFGSRDLAILAIYAEPRVLFPIPESPATFSLGLRAGWARRDASTETSTFESTGYGVGGVAAIQIGVARSLNVEALLSVNLLSFAPIFGSERDSGSVIGVQLGLSVPLPGTDF